MKALVTKFWLDVLIFAGFLALLQPRMTGMAVHEWLALAAAGAFVLHVLLHWDWIVGVTRTFFRKLLHASRLDYVVDALLFVAFTVIMTSGLVISRVVMPAFGLQLLSDRSWVEIHRTSSNVGLFLVATHFALHWSWVKNTFGRLVLAQFKRSPVVIKRQPAPTPLESAKAM